MCVDRVAAQSIPPLLGGNALGHKLLTRLLPVALVVTVAVARGGPDEVRAQGDLLFGGWLGQRHDLETEFGCHAGAVPRLARVTRRRHDERVWRRVGCALAGRLGAHRLLDPRA